MNSGLFGVPSHFLKGGNFIGETLYLSGQQSISSGPLIAATGTWLTGGTSTTTKPYVLIETTGATSTGWNTGGTGLGINSASGFAGDLINLQINGAMKFKVDQNGNAYCASAGNFIIPDNSIAMQSVVGVALANYATVTWSSTSAYSGARDLYLKRAGVATLQQGNTDADTNALISAQTFRSQGLLAGGTSNQAGKDWTFIASPGKGTGAGGQFIIQTAPAGATGTSVNAVATGLTVTAPVINMQPSVVVGNQALATTATDGFLYIPGGAGTPAGTPTAFTGRYPLYWDTTNKKLYIFDGTWLGGVTPGIFV